MFVKPHKFVLHATVDSDLHSIFFQKASSSQASVVYRGAYSDGLPLFSLVAKRFRLKMKCHIE